ncbi:TonB-linked outer membrane protein, SusC/RagA family [Chitinophaga sp. YR573]|uniref:SusC/RagA family TonB-linked outer membrane protein n=1 Tax=Chitinophaga sp. YR573 TaxID=1881040 RepID=UPI0008D2A393|nr:SusC/RagA family TonB-linked outer membrane protein [Chitinophaga sp. YR573]SEW37628.1 TonB-linked outer membrane protein, SusC/RagA family [Chitinophaga sp. YR573]
MTLSTKMFNLLRSGALPLSIALGMGICVQASGKPVKPGRNRSYSLPQDTAGPKIQVKGIVTDGTSPLPGVTVREKGTTNGTVSNADGSYIITVKKNATIEFTQVGLAALQEQVNGRQEINISLGTETKGLNEIVVTALGIRRESKTLTFAAQKLDGAKLNESRDANFVNSLSGKVAGIAITQSASGPGGASRVVLRGNRSISGNNNALFVVDGVAIDNSQPDQLGNDFGGYNGSDGAANINPDDIESVNIMKGAAAAALYGSRAANGAIIITTKKGKSGKIAVDYNGGIAMENPLSLPRFQNTYGQGNGGVSSTNASGSWGAATTTYKDNVKDFFRDAVTLNNSIAVTGGGDKTQGYLSYTNNKVQGIAPNNDLTRHTVNLRLNSQISKRLSTDAKLTYVNQDIENKPKAGEENGLIIDLYKVPRSVSSEQLKNYETSNPNTNQPMPLYWLPSSSIYMNPYWMANRTSYNEVRNRIMLLGSAKYEITPWLSIQGRYTLDRYNDKSRNIFYNGTLLFAGEGGSMTVGFRNVTERNADVLVSGNNNISKDLKISYNVGASDLQRKSDYTATIANGLNIPNKFDLLYATSRGVTTSVIDRELQSVYASANIGFRDYLFLDVSGRNDWSSTLPKPYSFFYPSVGLSAIVSDIVTLPSWMSFGKVRASYARAGNDPDPYYLFQTYTYEEGGTKGYIRRDGTKAIRDLKPEQTTSYEGGLEWRFLNNRVGFDITAYKTNSVNQLLLLALTPTTGFDNQYINAGNIQNKGIEITLNGTPVKQKFFQWNIILNYAVNRNKVIALSPDIKQGVLGGNGFGRTATPIVKEGSSYGDLYATRWARDASTGQYLLDDKGKPVGSASTELIGNFNPKYTFGFTNSFSFHNWSLSFLIDGKVGGVMTSGTEATMAYDGTAEYTEKYRGGKWVLPGLNQTTKQVNDKEIDAETFWTTVSGGRYSWGEFFTYDATNIRIRELTAGYTFRLKPQSVFKSAKISFVARNLLFLYRGSSIMDIPGIGKRKMRFDPDVNLSAGNFQGIEFGNLPTTRSLGLNVKLSF